MVTGESHYFFGKRYRLEVIERRGKHEIIIKNNSTLQLFINPGTTTTNRTKVLREWYRQQFSVVFYDFYLFERLLGIEENRETEIHDYLAKLELERKVTIKDGILSTTNLSQGQRKRLALLTAYLENRQIYLFDEWASDQDPVFKEIFCLANQFYSN